MGSGSFATAADEPAGPGASSGATPRRLSSGGGSGHPVRLERPDPRVRLRRGAARMRDRVSHGRRRRQQHRLGSGVHEGAAGDDRARGDPGSRAHRAAVGAGSKSPLSPATNTDAIRQARSAQLDRHHHASSPDPTSRAAITEAFKSTRRRRRRRSGGSGRTGRRSSSRRVTGKRRGGDGRATRGRIGFRFAPSWIRRGCWGTTSRGPRAVPSGCCGRAVQERLDGREVRGGCRSARRATR